MTLLTASLYLLCLAALLGSAVLVLARDPRSRLNRSYALLALALLGWVGTLFVFGPLPEGRTLLLVGRANFVAAALVATAAFLFMAELSGRRPRLLWLFWLETILLVALSQWTPLVDRAEIVTGGLHSTAYGPLFPVYILHVAAYLAAAVLCAFLPPISFSLPPGGQENGTAGRGTRRQLRLVGTGILATALVGVTANVVLPYGFGDFRFIDAGALSTIFLLVAVGYAVFFYHLFDVRLVVRAAFVYAGLVALALELYGLSLSFLARLLPLGDAEQRHYAATAAVLIVNAFTQGPVKRFLEGGMRRLEGIVGRRPARTPRL